MFEMKHLVQSIGQKYLKTYAKFMSQSPQRLHSKQERNFRGLRRSLKGTRLYRDLALAQSHSYQDFLQNVPVYNYEDYAPYVDMVAAGHKNILFKDRIEYFGLSSGTTGKDSKRIPYNKEMIQCFLKSQKRIASRLSLLEPEMNILGASRLTFGSDPYLYTRNEVKYGYISGILGTHMPKSLAKTTFPSKEVLAISNWDQKIEKLIEEALPQDIQVVSGIPTYIISIFEAVLQKTGKKYIREIWPNLKVFIYAATPIKQYTDRMDLLVGHELNYYGVYAATEAAIGLPYEKYQKGRQRYILNPDLLYSFTPTEGPKENLGLHQLQMGVPYYINIGSSNGLIHYSMKDLIMFEEHQGHLVFEFVGRKSTGMNLAAEKVSDDEILNCYLATKKTCNTDIRHFFLSPALVEGKTSYLWTLFVPNGTQVDIETLARTLDQNLQTSNDDYKDCRDIGVLGAAQVRIISADYLQNYFEENRDRGQFKMKVTFTSSEEYNRFMQDQFSVQEVYQ